MRGMQLLRVEELEASHCTSWGVCLLENTFNQWFIFETFLEVISYDRKL